MGTKRDARTGGWQWRFNNGADGGKDAGEGRHDGNRIPNNPNRKAIEAVATSIYITNFPKEWNETVIWKQCQEFGIVVDVYLSPRLSKVGKKFAFVRFIRVSNTNRKLDNGGSNFSHAQKAPVHVGVCNKDNIGETKSAVGTKKTYASILKRDQQVANCVGDKQEPNARNLEAVIPILPNDMISIPDSATIVLAKVKDLSIIENLPVVLMKEGFRNVEVNYIGGSWVWIEFDNRNACTRFKQREDLLKSFQVIQNVSRQFVVDDKIVWVEISGMPLGEGGFSSVYKGVLDDTLVVAVKVIHLQNRGAHKSFLVECEAWRGIRHRNLLKIITSCSSIDFQGNDFKALVYEFMPNGTLHDWLHSAATTSKLNLLQRINILIDVASALDYLHNHCLPTIVHCDLKPSNILLDGDMVAHVGDLGLARFLGTDSNQNSTNGFRGTVGYASPEYGVGSEMTSNGDVYSFGILLLELMTRKRPTDNIFHEGLNLHKFAYMALQDHVTDVIDVDLLSFLQEDVLATRRELVNAKKIEECLTSTIKIGVSCSLDSLAQRLDIANVVNELHHILDMLKNI